MWQLNGCLSLGNPAACDWGVSGGIFNVCNLKGKGYGFTYDFTKDLQ